MSLYHVLIVDDQRDVRRVLASGLQTLGHEMAVVEVPSAEEALLIAPRHSYDLIVTDVRLPGISGLELVRRVKVRNPSVKIILMTGAEDRQTRRQVEDAGVFAFFYKPIEMADFLDAVERALGLVETVFSPPPLDLKLAEEEPTPPEPAPQPGAASLTAPVGQTEAPLAPLTTLAAETGVVYAALLKRTGAVVSQVGVCRELTDEPALLSDLLETARQNLRLSISMKRPVPDYSLFMDGGSLSVCLTPVGKDHLLLIAGNQSFQNAMARVGTAMHGAVGELLEYVMGKRFAREPVPEPVKAVLEEAAEALVLEELPVLATEEDVLASLAEVEVSEDEIAAIEDLFGASSSELKVGSLDDFWDSAVEETGSLNLSDSHISYDEARDLGLTPE